MKALRMNHKLYSLIGGLILCCFFSCVAIAAESVVMVTELKGKAEIVLTNGKRPVTILSELATGSEIILGKDSQLVIIYLKSGSEFQLVGPAEIKIGLTAPQLVSGGKLINRPSLLTAQSVKLQGNLIQGAIRMRSVGEEDVNLLTPHEKILQSNPVFQWIALAGDQKFTFILQDSETGEVFIESQVLGTNFQLPENIKLVPGGAYTWAVKIDRGSGDVKTKTAEFILASEEEKERFMRLKPQPNATFSDRIVYATLLEQANFREDAITLWRELSAERPELAELRHMEPK